MAVAIYAEAGEAIAEKGLVLLDGPNGIAISLTPDTAEKAGQDQIQSAVEARRERTDNRGLAIS